jgi:hypothetical protein
MNAVNSSETRQYLPDYTVQHSKRHHLHIRRLENLKSHQIYLTEDLLRLQHLILLNAECCFKNLILFIYFNGYL